MACNPNNVDVSLQIILDSDIDDLQSLCSTNIFCKDLCKQNKELISKSFLDKMKVNYKDPNNYIYKQPGAIYRNNYTFHEMFKLYFRNYNSREINATNLGITSFPVYPNMDYFEGNNNKLTTFPIQPNMDYFEGNNNQLTTFPIQPNMTYFEGENNQLTTFPVQPNMKTFIGNNNQLTTFQIQPKMERFYGRNNKLTKETVKKLRRNIKKPVSRYNTRRSIVEI